MGQGCPKKEAEALARAAQGGTFQERFMSALNIRVKQSHPAEQPSDSVVGDGKNDGDEQQEHGDEHELPTRADNVAAHQQPPNVGDPLPEPDPGTLEELRLRLSRMADTDEIQEVLRLFLEDIVKPLLENHPYAPSAEIEVQIHRTRRQRIAEGDWIEYRGGDKRIEKRLGTENTLGRVVSRDKNGRPRIRWYDGTTWLTPYSLFVSWAPDDTFEDSTVRVLFGYQAQEFYPDAYRSYSADVDMNRDVLRPGPMAAEQDSQPLDTHDEGAA